MKVTIAEVARLAGVGAGTVSRVLNGGVNVSAATRERVQDAIAALGYVPNLIARGLAANRTGLVAATVPALGYTQHAEVVQGIGDCLHQHGITLMIGRSSYDLDVEGEIVAAFLARRPDAFYLTGTGHSEATRRLLRASGLPVVEGGNLTADPIDMVVGYSNVEAMRRMTHLLHARGHGEIWHVTTGNEPNDRIRDRLRGFEAACAELSLGARGRVLVCDNTLAGGVDAVEQALLADRSVVLQCATDVLAIGAALECQRRGLAVPDRIALTGFDDLPLAAALNPPLTTVRIDRAAMGRRIGEVIVGRLAGEVFADPVIDLGFAIIERGSTKADQR